MQRKFVYRIEWSDTDEGWLALCDSFPDLRSFDPCPQTALTAIMQAVEAADKAEGWQRESLGPRDRKI